ncbi:MAG TPA: hypothetical protein DCE42_08690 [Myxococcales bacterium]|nr:hypothetical protein [Deltaproteobacteria bacterium]MBU50672.1 hypothetical protein [Deltaproteobacteria bacterium]HAA54823.1 hypothetical protein [Myxococcales bacterium]
MIIKAREARLCLSFFLCIALLFLGCSSSTKTDGGLTEGSHVEKTNDEPASDAGGQTEGTNCEPGTLGCRCTPTSACFNDLRCEAGLCQACEKGTAGCACKDGDVCSTGLTCEGGSCQGCVGKPNCICHGNNTCDSGSKCVLSSTSVSICQACDGKDKKDCNCEKDADCGALACVNKRCLDLKTVNNIPKAPKCYSPCDADQQLADGSPRVCHPEFKLMSGCGAGQTCKEGSCIPETTNNQLSASQYPFCTVAADCPNWQTCLHGRCYSTCESSTQCATGFQCHKYVCRRECNVRESVCRNDETCQTSGSDSGICMPKSTNFNPAPPQKQTPGKILIPFHNIDFTNTTTTGELYITNKSQFTVSYTISRVRDSLGSDKPLFWMKFDRCNKYNPDNGRQCLGFANKPSAAEPYIVKDVPPNSMVILKLSNAGGKPKSASQYHGDIRIQSERMGEQEVQLKYRETGDGQWVGKMISFGNFNDTNIDKFPAAPSLNVRDVPNALLRRWINFKRNNLTFEQFRAALRAVREGTWRFDKVAKDCRTAFSSQASEDVVCYPFTNNAGYEILSYSNREAPVPSGISEMDFSINVEEKNGDSFIGRINSAKSLQYPGNPLVTLTFDGKPGVNPMTMLKAFGTTVDVGGRFHVAKDKGCPDTDKYEKVSIPWLIPGFESLSASVSGSLFRERYECRAKSYPHTPPDGATNEQKRATELLNLSLASSNPIPNGWRLRRKLELVDGGLIKNRYLFILYREKFVSFFNTSETKNALSGDFASYGYILMERVATELEKTDYAGNPPVKQNTCAINSNCKSNEACISGVCRPKDQLRQVTCSPAIVRMATNRSIGSMAELEQWSGVQLGELVSALIKGQSNQVTNDTSNQIPQTVNGSDYEWSYDSSVTNSKHYIHMYCEDTKQFNGGHPSDPQACPAGSKVIYFELQTSEKTLRNDACNKARTCDSRLRAFRSLKSFRENVPYKCKDPNAALCDANRTDPRVGKIFFKPESKSHYISPFQPLQNAMFEAFRYRLKFASRSGQSIGFTPSICAPGSSSQIPYCYDPKVIEEIEKRVDCVEAIFSKETLTQKLTPSERADLRNFLVFAFSFQNTNNNGVISTNFGFETLNAELRVMLGDESFVRSFASRYDLSNSSLISFQGDQLEPNGIKLSGALGFEMHNLYLSTQYYQSALDRFFSQSNVIYHSFKSRDTAFISPKSVTSYFKKLLLASTRKARSWSQIAKRYHKLNRPDLARHVIERAYAATYMEKTVLTRLLRELVRVTDPKEMDQISNEIDSITLTYKSALIDMKETYQKLNMSLNNYGLPEGYIPFPAMDSFSALSNSTNAFKVSLGFAKEKMLIARNKEQAALQSKRSFDTNAAQFQAELVRITQNFESQLQEICGGITVGNRVFPAIPKYASLSPKTRSLGNPCGLVPGGALFNALAELEKIRIGLTAIKQQQANLTKQIHLERDRIKKYCDAKFKLADITWNFREKQQNLQLELEETQRNIDRTVRIGQQASMIAETVKCSIVVGFANGGDCPMAAVSAALLLVVGATQEAIVAKIEQKLKEKREQQVVIERELEKTQIQFECKACAVSDKNCTTQGTAYTESNIKIAELTASIGNLSFEALKIQYDIQIALSNITRLRQQARRLITQQNETTQLALDVQAAQNNPNVRIYKNDSIISAERTFSDAMREAYRATLIYEYYTGTSYKRKGNLYLIRMISFGDVNLETYLSRLEQAFRDFEEQNGKPDFRVAVISLRDDILKISRVDENQHPRTLTDRVSEFQKELSNRNRLNEEGFTSFPFNLSVTNKNALVSPITVNHKVIYIEAEIVGGEIGDTVGRVYVRQKGTGVVRLPGDDTKFYVLPAKTAVVNAFFNGSKVFQPSIYQNYRLRDRPLGNTQWEVLINQLTEKANKDINLNSINDIRIYIYYSDFTEEP